MTHRQHTFQCAQYRFGITGGQQIRQILYRNTQAFDVWQNAVATQLTRVCCRLNRRQRRHVPDHRQCAIFWMQRQRQFPFHCHFINRRLLCGFNNAQRNTVFNRLLDDFRIVRIEEHVQLTLVKIFLVLGAGCTFNGVGIVQQHAEITDTTDTGFRAHGRLTRFNTRIAEDALLRLTALPVEVDFFVWASGDAHTPATAFILVDQDDAIFFTLVNRTARAGRHTCRVQAVFAQARQIHHEGVFELAIHRLLDVVEVLVFRQLVELTAQVIFPVRPFFDFRHPFPGNQRTRTGNRLRFAAFRRGMQVLIVKIERLVIIVDPRQMRVSEDFTQQHGTVTHARLQFAVDFTDPAAFVFFLVFPVSREALARLGFHVVEPRVFHAFAAGPDVFTGN